METAFSFLCTLSILNLCKKIPPFPTKFKQNGKFLKTVDFDGKYKYNCNKHYFYRKKDINMAFIYSEPSHTFGEYLLVAVCGHGLAVAGH